MKRLILPVGLALISASTLRAQFNPIPLNSSSYNYNVIIPNATPPFPVVPGGATDASMDQGVGNGGDTWNEQGYFTNDTDAAQVTVGLPPAGSTIRAQSDVDPTNHMYTFASTYVGKCAILIDAGVFTNANWHLTTPTAYNALSFLTSGGNGGCQIRWTVQRMDGTTDTGTFASPDWFFTALPRGWTSNGRCAAQGFTLDNYSASPLSDNPRLYTVDVPVPTSSSPVTNINLKFVSSAGGAHSCVMAIAGTRLTDPANTFVPILGTGYNADIVVEASAPRLWSEDRTPGGVIPPVNATMDGGTNLSTETVPRLQGDTWFEQGYYTPSNTFGLPHPGTTFTSVSQSDHHYTMPASYSANSTVMLDNSNTTATITFVTPTAFTALSLLGSSGGGGANLTIVVTHNNSSTETQYVTLGDWFGNTPVAWTANGRISVGNGLFDTINGNNPRLLSLDFLLNDSVTPVSTLSLTWTNGGRAAIFAVSGATGAVAPSIAGPNSVGVSEGASASLTVTITGFNPITQVWQKGTNNVWVNTSDTTTTYSIPSASASDEADYRVIASNAGGNATSVVAHVTVLSSLPRITLPSDPIVAYQPNGGSSPTAEAVVHAIDGVTQKYLNFGANGGSPFAGPVGFIVTPSAGRTFLQVYRLYTANDAPERDPANSIFEGSNDGGGTWTLISSNGVTMPDGRNAGGSIALDPTTQNIVQVRLSNTTRSYAMYRWSVTTVKNVAAANSMQIGEVEMLGTVDNSGAPTITTAPSNTVAYVYDNASLVVGATGTGLTYQWYRGSTALSDGGNIAGASTSALSISPTTWNDAADYNVVVMHSSGNLTTAPVHLTIVSTLTDVTQPGDPISAFGDASAGFWGGNANPALAINEIFDNYQNGGHGFSAAAGFPPFLGPVGVIVTQSVAQLVVGIRIYTSNGDPERDPADVELFGSNDGITWTPMLSSALNLPLARTSAANAVEPIHNPMQEILFDNQISYTNFMVQFTHTKNDNAANSLQIGELELLGGTALTAHHNPDGTLTLTWPTGTLLEATSLSGPWQTNTGSSPLIVTPTGPQKFYKIIVQ